MLSQIEHQRRDKMITELPDAETLLQRRRCVASCRVVSRLVLSRRVASCRRPFYFLCPSISSPLPLILQSAKIAESLFLLKTSIIITDFFRHFCTFNTYSVNAQSFNFAAYSVLQTMLQTIHLHIALPIQDFSSK